MVLAPHPNGEVAILFESCPLQHAVDLAPTRNHAILSQVLARIHQAADHRPAAVELLFQGVSSRGHEVRWQSRDVIGQRALQENVALCRDLCAAARIVDLHHEWCRSMCAFGLGACCRHDVGTVHRGDFAHVRNKKNVGSFCRTQSCVRAPTYFFNYHSVN